MFTKLKLAWQNSCQNTRQNSCQNTCQNLLQNLRQNLRQLSGEDAYERYLVHFYEHQVAKKNQQEEQNAEEIAAPPLSREAFYKEWQTSKWKGIKRCC